MREAISGMPSYSQQSTVKSRPVDDVRDTGRDMAGNSPALFMWFGTVLYPKCVQA